MASAEFGDGERCGSGELSEENSSSVGKSMSSGIVASLPLSGRDGGSGRGGPRYFSAWLPPTEFAGAHYPPVIGSRVSATRPSAWPAPLVLPPSLGSREGTSLQGDGLLDCWT